MSDKKLNSQKSSKEIIKESWQARKKAWKQTVQALGNILKWTYKAIDAWDRLIWEQIEKNQINKWKKSPWRVKRFLRDNTIKLLIASSIAGYWWMKVSQEIHHRQENEIETVDKRGSDTIVIDDFNELEEKEYLKNPKFFEKNLKVEKDSTYADKWVILIRDAWTSFYVVQEWDNITIIKSKLSKIREFSYLSSEEYDIPASWRNIRSFNVPSSSLVPWLFIPIPIEAKNRQLELKEFKHYAKSAINEMKNDENYSEKMSELLKNVKEQDVINIMTAFARCETAEDWTEFSDPIWSVELHRWEPWSEKSPINAFSFSYYHILMEKNADWKTSWPWLKAREKLWLTEWQCYHPKNAWKLFLWYCFEKKKSDPTFFFNIKNLEDAKKVWKVYNWLSDYWNKLWANIQYVSG